MDYELRKQSRPTDVLYVCEFPVRGRACGAQCWGNDGIAPQCPDNSSHSAVMQMKPVPDKS